MLLHFTLHPSFPLDGLISLDLNESKYYMKAAHKMQDGKRSKEALIRELQELRQKVTKLETLEPQVHQTESELKEKNHAPGERVKEFNCLIEISNLVEKHDASIKGILNGIVKLIITSWRYPEITAAQISFGNDKYTTENFRPTAWKLRSDFKVYEKHAGFIEIYYLEERPDIDDGPFLQEEKKLIHAIAALVGRIIERKQASQELRENKNVLSQIIYANSIPTFVLDKDHKVTHWNTACANLTGIPADQIIGTNMQWKVFYKEPKPVMADNMLDNRSEDELLKFYGNKGRKSATIDCAYEAEDFFPDLGKDGKWLFFTASPIRNARGIITGAIETLQDITEHKMAEETLRSEVAYLEQTLKERSYFQSIIGKNSKMQEIYNLLENLADTDTTVLITGSSGTGKELVARAIHYSGIRSKNPMITINCSALSENLLESELFGHVKGAFTGAIKNKKGRFELADGGTIFLDEIGDISPRIQLKLLRVLQEKEFERVGDAEPRKVDVRVITATNHNLKEKVLNREFREDLYYRLKVVEVHIPSLQKRKEDIPLLTNHFFKLFKKSLKKSIKNIDASVLRIFMQYSWPGNIRELEHAIEHAVILCQGKTIIPEHLPPEITENISIKEPSAKKEVSPDMLETVVKTLNQTDWNKAKTCRSLGISRTRLYRLLTKYSLKKTS